MATTRGEGSNARIKSNTCGRLKRYNMFEFGNYVQTNYILRQHLKAVDMIKKLIQERRWWSDFVHKLWSEQNSLIGPFQSTQIELDSSVCIRYGFFSIILLLNF